MRITAVLLFASLVCAHALVAQGESVTINNPSFESPAQGANGFSGTITGWQDYDQAGTGAGVFFPTTTRFPGGVPDGNQTAFSNGGGPGGFISQVLGEPLTAGATYTLQVDAGRRLDSAFPGATVQLRSGGVVLNQAVLVDPGAGNFTTGTVNYTATAADAQLGKPLEVRLLVAGGQPNFDNVRLDSTRLSARTPVSVTNASFEADVLGETGFTLGSLTGWTAPGNQGAFNPAASQGHPTDGSNIAFSGGGTISQILAETLQSSTNYQLSVDIVDRFDATSNGYQVQLLAGGVLLAEDNNSLLPVPANGDFLTSLVSFDALAGNPQLGQPLEIRLISAAGGQTNFDNVRLSSVIIPEPTSILLWSLLGVLGMVGVYWRRAKVTSA